jgi:hypothetical protein
MTPALTPAYTKIFALSRPIFRNQYRLIYRPAELRHNGAFHRVELKAPERLDNIKIRSGYYAPAH